MRSKYSAEGALEREVSDGARCFNSGESVLTPTVMQAECAPRHPELESSVARRPELGSLPADDGFWSENHQWAFPRLWPWGLPFEDGDRVAHILSRGLSSIPALPPSVSPLNPSALPKPELGRR